MPRAVFSVCLFCAVTSHALGDVIEDFTTDPGWTEFGNTAGGNIFGFSNTNNTGGVSGPGEAGGTFARSTNLAYYADVFNGGLSLDTPFRASGELDVTSSSSFNNNVFVGHFGAAASEATNSPANFVGMGIIEGSAVADFRSLSFIRLMDGSFVSGDTLLGNPGAPGDGELLFNGDYTWSYSWNPSGGVNGGGLLEYELFNNLGASIGTSNIDLTAAQRAVGLSIDAFGLSTGGLGAVNPGNQVNLFIDDVSYTVPEPSSMALVGISLLCLVGTRRMRSMRDAAT